MPGSSVLHNLPEFAHLGRKPPRAPQLEVVEDRGAWHAAVLGVAKSQIRLGYLTPPPPRVWIRGGEYPSISKGLLFQVGTELAEQFLFK